LIELCEFLLKIEDFVALRCQIALRCRALE
jgi:hypothetical protein